MENVHNVAAAILKELGVMDAMKFEKLLYYAQAWKLAISNEPLFASEVQAWKYGPVIPEVYFHHAGTTKVGDWDNGDPEKISPTSRRLVSMVCSEYGHLSSSQLSKRTHEESPWLDARGDLPEDAPSKEPITQEAMGRYYRRFGSLAGQDAVGMAYSGILTSEMDEGPDLKGVSAPASTAVYGYGQRGLTPDQLALVRASRRPRTRV
ncbi:Panacea domain-containing protein [Arthrobacter sp. NPDC058127]|uniref:Panacea domain-containing protein n=1 Tax=Arthrobacter sp. NPDC058127 TaxID=3346351 RepID=UPI0036E155B1